MVHISCLFTMISGTLQPSGCEIKGTGAGLSYKMTLWQNTQLTQLNAPPGFTTDGLNHLSLCPFSLSENRRTTYSTWRQVTKGTTKLTPYAVCCGHRCSLDCHFGNCILAFPTLFKVEPRSDPALLMLLQGAWQSTTLGGQMWTAQEVRPPQATPPQTRPRAEGPTSNQNTEKPALAYVSGGSALHIFFLYLFNI